MQYVFYDAESNDILIPDVKLAIDMLYSLIFKPKELPNITYLGQL